MANFSNDPVALIQFVFFKLASAVTLALLCTFSINFLLVSGHNAQRCVEVIGLSVMGITVLIRAAKGQLPIIPHPARLLLLAFFMLGLASAAMSYSPRHAMFEWAIFVLLLTVVFAVAAELSIDARRLTGALQLAGLACAVYSLRLLLMYAVSLTTGFQSDMYSLAVGFSNPRFLNHTQTALLPLIVLLCVQSPRAAWGRKGWFALAALWWALLFVSEARASTLALAIGCAAALALRRGHARQFVATMAWTAVAGAILYALLFILLPVLAGLDPVGMPLSVVERTVAEPTSSRNLLWKLAVELIAAHPWLGVGPHHYAHAGATLYSGAHPHNWMLQVGAEWGIPALLCLLGVMFLGARGLVRSGARIVSGDLANHQILVALLVACSAIFLDGIFSGVIVMPQSQLAIALVLGVTLAWTRLQEGALQPAAPVPAAATRVVVIALVTAGLCGLIWSVAPDFVARARGNALTPAEVAANPAVHWPRMWEAGFF